MPNKVPQITAVRPNTLLATADRYLPIGCTADGSATTEADVEFRIRKDGYFFGLWAYVDTVSSANIILKFRKNNADQNQDVTITSTGTKVSQLEIDSVSSGDDVNLMYDRASGQAGISMIREMYRASGTGLYMPCVSNSPGGLNLGTTDRYPAVMGEISGVINESYISQREIHFDAVWSNLYAYSSSNTKSVSVPVKSRVNGSNGNQAISFPSSTSGVYEDLSSTDSLTAGDLINYYIGVAGTGLITISTLASLLHYDTTEGFSLWSDSRTNATRTASGTTHFLPLTGGNNGWISNTSEASAQVPLGVNGTISNFTAYISSNGYTGSPTVRLRINGSNANSVLNPTAGVSGKYEDLSGTDAILEDDLVCVSVTGGTSGTANFRGFAVKFTYTVNDDIDTLSDNFDDSSLDTGKWVDYGGGGLSETGGQLEITKALNSFDTFGIYSVDYYNLEDSEVFIKLEDAGTQSATFYTVFEIATGDNYVSYFWHVNNNALRVYKKDNTTSTSSIFSTTYNSTTHKWLRIREASGTIYFDTSSDGSSWTNQYSESRTVDLKEVYVGVYCYSVTTESARTVIIDNFNIAPSAGATINPSAQTATFTIPSYSVTAIKNVSISPSAQTATFSIPTYTVDTGSPSISDFFDDFNDNSIDTAKWDDNSSGQITETGGALSLDTIATDTSYLYLESDNTYDLTSGAIFIQVTDVPDDKYNNIYPILLYADANNEIGFFCKGTGTTLYAYKKVSGTPSTLTSTTISSPFFVRIIEDSGTIYWEYATVFGSWTTLHSESAPITITDLNVRIVVTMGSASGGSSESEVDNLNILDSLITPTTQSATFSIPSYSVSAIGNTTQIPDVQVATFSIPSYSIVGDSLIQVATQSATFSIPSYSVQTQTVIAPSTQSAVFSIPSYSIFGEALIQPSVQTATFTIPSYIVDTFVEYENTHSLRLVASSSQYAYIDDGSQTGLDITDDLTLEGLVSFRSLPSTGNDYIFFGKDDFISSRGYYLKLRNESGTLRLEMLLNTGTIYSIYQNWTPELYKWYRVGVSRHRSSGEIKFYVNGKQVGTTQTSSTGAINNSSAPFSIGCHFGSGTPYNFADFLVDDVRVWNDVRTLSEIRETIATELQGNEANLVAYWALNNDTTDRTSNGNDLTLSGSPTYSDVDLPFIARANDREGIADDLTVGYWKFNGDATDESANGLDLTAVNSPVYTTGFLGDANGAIDLEASSSQYLYINDTSALDVRKNITIKGRIKPESITGNHVIVSKGPNISSWSVSLWIDSSSRLNLLVSSNGSDLGSGNYKTFQSESGAISTGEFQYIFVSFNIDNENCVMLKDGYDIGASVVSGTGIGSTIYNNSHPLFIGAWDRDGVVKDFFDGVIDDLQIVDFAESPQEALKSYTGIVTARFVPDANPESATVDGRVNHEIPGGTPTWATLRDGAGTDVLDTGTNGHFARVSNDSSASNYDSLYRSIFGFDTNISESLTLHHAHLSFMGDSAEDPVGGQSVVVDRNVPASATGLVASDYAVSNWDEVEQAEYRMSVSSWNPSGRNELLLNATGRSNVNLSGLSWFGLRISSDFDDSAPTFGGTFQTIQVGGHFSDTTYKSDKPVLYVELVVGIVNATINANTQTATFSLPSSSVTTVRNVSVSPNTQTATFSLPTREVKINKTIQANTQELTFSIPSYVITGDIAITVLPSVQTATFSLPSRAVIYDSVVSVAVQELTFSIPNYSIDTIRNVIIEPITQVLVFVIPTYQARGDFWQDKYGTINKTWNDKYFPPSKTWNEKYPNVSKTWNDKY